MHTRSIRLIVTVWMRVGLGIVGRLSDPHPSVQHRVKRPLDEAHLLSSFFGPLSAWPQTSCGCAGGGCGHPGSAAMRLVRFTVPHLSGPLLCRCEVLSAILPVGDARTTRFYYTSAVLLCTDVLKILLITN